MADPVLLITGASSGIGEATARAASGAGYRVVLAARSAERLAALAQELGGPDRARAVACDVTVFEDQQAAVATALDAFGRLDAAMANAGLGARTGFLEETPERWRAMVLTNVLGPALTIRAAVPALRETRGHLLLTSSTGGRRVVPGSLYSCTKWAVSAMAEAARAELHADGIRVTSIAPGRVDTPIFDEPQPAALRASDVAAAALFALSQRPDVNVNEVVVRPMSQAN